jgi:hypothetical protein
MILSETKLKYKITKPLKWHRITDSLPGHGMHVLIYTEAKAIHDATFYYDTGWQKSVGDNVLFWAKYNSPNEI